MAIFDIWMEWVKHIWVSILPWRLPSIFCSRENIGLKMLFEELQDGCLVHGHLWYLNGKILAILSLNRTLSFEDNVWRIPWRLLSAWPSLVSECNDLSIWLNWLVPTIKVLPKRTYGLEDVVWRISRWLFSAWPFLINEWVDFSYFESPCCRTHPIKFLLETIYGLEDVVWRISRCLFSSENWLEWFLFILSLHVVWCIPIIFCSREYIGWKKLFKNIQKDCLVHDHLLYLSEMKEAFMSLFMAWSIQSRFCS